MLGERAGFGKAPVGIEHTTAAAAADDLLLDCHADISLLSRRLVGSWRTRRVQNVTRLQFVVLSFLPNGAIRANPNDEK